MENVLMVAIIVAGVVALVWLILKYASFSGGISDTHNYLNHRHPETPTWEITTHPVKNGEDK